MDPVLGAAAKRRGKAAGVRGVSRTLSVLPWKSSLRMDVLSLIRLLMSKHFLVSFISATLFCFARTLVAVWIVVLNSYMYQSILKLEYI